jgi:hypothetical protein
VASATPALRNTLIRHLHGAAADRVDRSYFPAAMMQEGCGRFRKRHQVVIAAVDAMHEADAFTRPIRQAQAEYTAIEIDRLRHVDGKGQDVGHALGPPNGMAERLGAPATPGGLDGLSKEDLRFGEVFPAGSR